MATNQQSVDVGVHVAESSSDNNSLGQPELQSTESTSVYRKTKEQLRSINDEIKVAKDQLLEVNNRLESWGLAAMEAVGLGVDNVSDDSHLFVLPNQKLSREDLARKQELLHDRISELAAQLRSEYAIIRQLKVNARLERQQQLGVHTKHYRIKVVDEYKANPKKFFGKNIPDLTHQSSNNKKEIVKCAGKLLIVAEIFNIETDITDIWRGWCVVAKARNMLTEEYDTSILSNNNKREHRNVFREYEKYVRGAKEYLEIFSLLLPPRLQGLQLLYADRDFDRVEYYLQEVFSKNILTNDAQYLELLVDLASETQDTALRVAAKELQQITGFSTLEHNVATLLVQQQAYLILLRFDVSFLHGYIADADIKKIQSYLQDLDEHIRAACINPTSISTLQAEFDKIKLQIDAQAKIIQQMLLPNSATSVPVQLELGSGLGLGWLYGVKRSSYQLHGADHFAPQDKVSLADNIDAGDYKFILAEDTFWQRAIKPWHGTEPKSNIFTDVVKALRGLFISEFDEKESLGRSHYVFTVPDRLMMDMEKIAPGFGAKLAAHFQRRANDIHIAIEQANNINDSAAADLIIRDLDQLESEWLRIMRSVHSPEEFCTVVDLYLTTRYAVEREQYIEIARDLRRQPYIEQERKVLLFEYQHEREEIQELHNLKEILQQIVRPNR